jgi:hypothetical protein
VIRLDVAGLTASECLRVLARQREAEVLGDLTRDFFFCGEDVISPSAILRAPDPPALDVGQLDRDLQRAAALQHAPSEHRFDTQRTSDLERPLRLPFVTEDRTLCGHSQ